MKLGGLQETSLLDYPGKIAAIVWTVGCNFRCPFCYNRQLVFGETEIVPLEKIDQLLEKRKGKLDAVSITGGEPLLHKDIGDFMRSIKEKGYLVKVDTNGTFPDHLKQLLDEDLIDYVSMDVKATKENYHVVAGVPVDVDAIDRSIHIIQEQAPTYEFKTTVVPTYHTKEDIVQIAEWLQGSKQYFLQQFKVDSPLISDELLSVRPYDNSVLLGMCEEIRPFFKECSIRGI
jgi:pyruvate formate lyase activating enzyme